MLIGIDVGTTAVKAALFDEAGHARRHFSETYPTSRPEPGHVEQDPENWTQLVTKALAVLSENVAIKAIGLCSQVNTHIFVDEQGRALRPAMTWQDTRCAPDAAHLDARIGSDDKSEWWGALCRLTRVICWRVWSILRAPLLIFGRARAMYWLQKIIASLRSPAKSLPIR